MMHKENKKNTTSHRIHARSSRKTTQRASSNKQLIRIEFRNSTKNMMKNSELMESAERILKLAMNEGLNIRGLVIHDNLDIVASIDSRKNLRLQRIFLKADSDVLRSLFRNQKRKPLKGDINRVNKFIVDNPPGRDIKTVPKTLLRGCYGPVGEHYNLNQILEKIMQDYTGRIPDIHITWRKASVGKTHITWGTCRELGKGGIIKINKILDNPDVPRYMVESIVYHELLHFVVPTVACGDEYSMHSDRFNELLSKFPHCEKAEIWKKNFLFDYRRKKSKTRRKPAGRKR